MGIKDFLSLFKAAAIAWWNDNTFRLAASLAFYTIFSLAPIVLVAVGVTAIVFGEDTATRQLVVQVQGLAGPEGGRAVREIIESLERSGSGPMAAFVGAVTVLIGSTVVFAELQSALNKIWDVKTHPNRSTIVSLVRTRVLSFVIVLGVGFLLLVSLVVNAVIAGAQEYLTQLAPSVPWLWSALNLVVSFVFVTLLFMLIYKVLPDVQISWRDVTVGALVTAVLFSLGKYAIGVYLGRMSVGSAYGAAGSFAVLLIWIYYSALISFFGAEFTQVFARRYGSRIRPEEHAVRRGERPTRSETRAAGPRRFRRLD